MSLMALRGTNLFQAFLLVRYHSFSLSLSSPLLRRPTARRDLQLVMNVRMK